MCTYNYICIILPFFGNKFVYYRQMCLFLHKEILTEYLMLQDPFSIIYSFQN